MRKISRSSVELTAAAVEPMAPPAAHPTLRGVQATASALAPAVFPTERWRSDTKAAMLREFTRPKVEAREDAGSQDGIEQAHTSPVVRVDLGGSRLSLADMEEISVEQAADAPARIAGILSRHESTTRLS